MGASGVIFRLFSHGKIDYEKGSRKKRAKDKADVQTERIFFSKTDKESKRRSEIPVLTGGVMRNVLPSVLPKFTNDKEVYTGL